MPNITVWQAWVDSSAWPKWGPGNPYATASDSVAEVQNILGLVNLNSTTLPISTDSAVQWKDLTALYGPRTNPAFQLYGISYAAVYDPYPTVKYRWFRTTDAYAGAGNPWSQAAFFGPPSADSQMYPYLGSGYYSNLYGAWSGIINLSDIINLTTGQPGNTGSSLGGINRIAGLAAMPNATSNYGYGNSQTSTINRGITYCSGVSGGAGVSITFPYWTPISSMNPPDPASLSGVQNMSWVGEYHWWSSPCVDMP